MVNLALLASLVETAKKPPPKNQKQKVKPKTRKNLPNLKKRQKKTPRKRAKKPSKKARKIRKAVLNLASKPSPLRVQISA